MDYKARAYDPWLGRWTQLDTIVPGAANPQAWNRFAYVGNNPINAIDPSGHKACIDWDKNGNCIVDPFSNYGIANTNSSLTIEKPTPPKLTPSIPNLVPVQTPPITGPPTPTPSNSTINHKSLYTGTPLSNTRIETPKLSVGFDFGFIFGNFDYNLGIGSDYPDNPITIAYPPQISIGPFSSGFDGISIDFKPSFSSLELSLLSSINVGQLSLNPSISMNTQSSITVDQHTQILQNFGFTFQVRTNTLVEGVLILTAGEYLIPVVLANPNTFQLRPELSK